MQHEWPALKLVVKRLPTASQSPAVWERLMQDDEYKEDFRNLLPLFEVILVLPISTAACERGFSCMKRIKHDWRSSLATDTLCKLMYISIEGPTHEEYNCAVALDRWWNSGDRQL